MEELERLQRWYHGQCDGEWEREFGVEISNVGNPGWTVLIDLRYTDLEEKAFDSIKETQRADEDDWIFCRVEEMRFDGGGGPQNLTEILRIFLEWAES